MKDLKSNITTASAFDIQAITTDTTTNGNIIDLQGYNGATIILHSGTLTAGAFTPKIEDGDDSGLSDAAEVSDTFLIGTEAEAAFAATDDDATRRIGYVGNKRYLRLSVVSASSANGTMSAIVIRHFPFTAPKAQDS